MKISIYSHATGLGGAELALLNLVKILKYQRHDLIVFLPQLRGVLIKKLNALNVRYQKYDFVSSLPNTANAIRSAYSHKSEKLASDMIATSPDLVIVNTLSLLQVQLVAAKHLVPCIVYVHEDLENDFEISPSGWSGQFYNKVASNASSHLLCGSKFTQNSFDISKSTVFYPFDSTITMRDTHFYSNLLNFSRAKEIINRMLSLPSRVSLFVVGNKSLRKNATFAVTVAKALQIRGMDCELYLIGAKGSSNKRIKKELLIRKTKNVHFYTHLNDPYSIGGSIKINLICSTTEPFGLTTTDCFSLGIPTVASKSGGPCEILDEDVLYEINDLDQCVRKIENVASNYALYSQRAFEKSVALSNEFSLSNRSIALNSALSSAVSFGPATITEELHNAFLKIGINLIDIFPQEVALKNIETISKLTSQPLTLLDINKIIELEKRTPGYATSSDIEHFNVVPFANSIYMANLYKNGLGLAIELSTYMHDTGKQEMMRFINMHLIEDTLRLGSPLNILCLGDGLGVDSIWLANLGANVDYMDYDQSMISLCAEKNIEYFLNENKENPCLRVINKPEATYDYIICLEVIEHVSNAHEFLKYIASHLTDNGKLFISECFNGVVQRWPTHLYENEQFSNEMHHLALPQMCLVDVNLLPYAKPYVLKKNNFSDHLNSAHNGFINQRLIKEYLKSKKSLGY
jgi:glycosyltransferase involved in cell wall biosynthesis/SAM-dependent methyltransferase